MKRTIHLFLVLFIHINGVFAQEITQYIKGKVVDQVTGEPVINASVIIEGSNPIIGTVTNIEGEYRLEHVKVGRYNLIFSSIGFKQIRIPEVLLTSVQPYVLDVKMEIKNEELEEAVVVAHKGKEAINSMASISSRSFTIEESSRLAGGLSDPSRVAYNFPGVTFSAPQDNGVVIRGNSPSSVLWRLNGIDVSGVAHFAGGNLAGAGLISAYSANILKGSDFFSGAYPAEYSNSTSGAFDIKFRRGNSEKHKRSIQLGILGVDAALEGPFKKGKKASYNLNYRHGFIGYYGALAKGVEPHYQDISFNLYFPSKKLGIFSIWGIGGLSKSIVPYKRYQEKVDKNTKEVTIKEREYFEDFLDKDISFGVGAIGLNNQKQLSKNAFIRSSLGYTINHYHNFTDLFTPFADTLNSGVFTPYEDLKNNESKIQLASSIFFRHNFKLSSSTGIRASLLQVNSHAYQVDNSDKSFKEIYNIKGHSHAINIYSQFKYNLHPKLTCTGGVATTYFKEVKELSLEPRLSINWQFSSLASFSLAYGKHTKQEELKTYFYRNPAIGKVNDILFSKSDHYIVSLDVDLSENTSLKIEGYYQNLYDVPVTLGTTYSFLNFTTLWDVGEIVNTGTGNNKGVDISIERTMSNGFYYLFSTSFFDSKYTDDLQVERNTLYNRKYIISLATGKEMVVLGKNLFGINFNITHMGGGRLTPFKIDESHQAQEVVYDIDRLYDSQAPSETWLNVGLTYKVNKKNTTKTWGIDFQNALLTEQVAGYKYNLSKNTIDKDLVLFILPNFYYKVEF